MSKCHCGITACTTMQHITTLQVQGMYGIPPDTTQHTLIAHRKGRASRVSPTRLPCPAVIICQGDIVVSLHVPQCSISQHCKFRECMVYLLTQLSTHSSHTAKAGLQGSALPGCPALLSSYVKVSLWYHCMYHNAAYHNTASSGNVWYTS